MSVIAAVFELAAILGMAEVCAGALLVRRFCRGRRRRPATFPPISVLKPLKGSEPMLEQALASFCGQDYPEFQVIFGAADADDEALAVARRVAARFPERDITFVTDPTARGTNLKVANLIAMWPAARHDLLVIADQDVHAPVGTLAQLSAALEDPRVGLVSALYTGVPGAPGLVGEFGASRITHDFLPATLIGRALGREDTLGATMALKREVLERAGGFEAIACELADDAVLGRRVAALGLKVGLAWTVVGTTVAERRIGQLFRHELRWARTIRSLAALGFAASALGYPLIFALGAVAASGAAVPSAVGLFCAVWAARVALARATERALGVPPVLPIWAFPLRDMFSLAVLLASYAGNRVEWRGAVLRAGRAGCGTCVPVPQRELPSR